METEFRKVKYAGVFVGVLLWGGDFFVSFRQPRCVPGHV